MAYIKVSGTKLVDANGKELILRGAGLGGWMKCVEYQDKHARPLILLLAWRTSSPVRMLAIAFARSLVDWTAGYPGCEHQIRAALAEVVGKEKSEFFFDKVCKTLCQ